MPSDDDKLLTPAECAALWRVDSKTIARWAQKGKLNSIRTLGGHRRFRESEVRALIDGTRENPLDAPVTALWDARTTSTPRKKLADGGIVTVGQLIALDAAGLARLGIRGAALDSVRLALYHRGLALHGEVAGSKVA